MSQEKEPTSSQKATGKALGFDQGTEPTRKKHWPYSVFREEKQLGTNSLGVVILKYCRGILDNGDL